MSVIKASPRTACVWPGYVRTFLCCFHSLIVLSAEPSSPSRESVRGAHTARIEWRIWRTRKKLARIDGEHGPDRLLVANQVVQQLEVLPYLCRPEVRA